MTTIINLEGQRTGPKRIAERFAAERDRVEGFNQHMTGAGMPLRTAMWKGIVR